MFLYLFTAKVNGIDTVLVEGTNLFRVLSYVYPIFDCDNLLDPRNVSKDGSLHEGTKIRSYLLKQEDVKYINAWEELKDKKEDIVPEIASAETFGMYRRNSGIILYCGEFIDNIVKWINDKQSNNLQIILGPELKDEYSFSYLNKVKDNQAKKYAGTRKLF